MSVYDQPHVYLVATDHPEFKEQHFPAGSIVLDPWGYLPPREDVRLRALGRHRQPIISLLVPSRGRPTEFKRMLRSAYETATHPRQLETVAYWDRDDPMLRLYNARAGYPDGFPGATLRMITSDRIVLSDMWNACYRQARGEILMHCGDDIVFRTPGWDTMVREEFARWPDRIVLVQGDDLSPNREALATHGFLHRRWVETVGYFVPPLFSSDWNDVWLTDVADKIQRRVRLDFVTEHLHYSFGKAEHDLTYREREERGARDNVTELYKTTERQRKKDAEKLRIAIKLA